MKKDVEYNQLMIALFSILVDINDINSAIIILYESNKKRGVKI